MSLAGLDLASRRAGWRRWLLPALAASLIVNAFFAGLAVTDYFRKQAHAGAGPRALRFELRWFADRLPAEGIAAIETALEDIRPSVEARLARLQGIRTEINRLAAVPAPDRAAIDAQLVAVRAESAAIQAEVERTTFDALLALPPDARAALDAPPER